MPSLTSYTNVGAVNSTDELIAVRSGSTVNVTFGSISSQSASAVAITGGSIAGITDLAIADGGTGASTAADARTNLGLGTLATQSGTFSGTSSGTNTGDQTNISGNAATVTTNANLTGHVTSTGNAAVLGSFTSANLATALTDETGTGVAVFATSPTLVTPILGVAAATSVNKVTLTAPATGSTLTIAEGKTLTASNTLTFTGTDSSSVAFGTGGTVSYAVKATGAEVDTGTDDAKFVTAKAINDSHNVPSVAPGTTGNVMTSNGTDWISSASGSGALVLLNSQIAVAASSIAFSSTYITSTYDKYIIEYDGVYTSTSSDLYLTVSTDNGSVYLSASYKWATIGASFTVTTPAGDGSSSDAKIAISGSQATGGTATTASIGTIKFGSPSASAPCNFQYHSGGQGANAYSYGCGVSPGNVAVNNIKIAPATGTVTGNFRLYGIVK